MATSTVGDLPMKTESPAADDSDFKAADCETSSYSPLNLKLSPSQRYPVTDHKVTASYAAEDAIRNQLQDFFITPEASFFALEEKAQSLRQFYGSLTTGEKVIFLRMLATCFGVDQNLVQRLAGQITSSSLSHGSDGLLLKIEDRLRQALVPRYQHLFMTISRLDRGIHFLLHLRSDVITILVTPGVDQNNHHFQMMNSILHNLLSIWMSVGPLRLEKVTWESPCDLLQKICAYEAVKSIRNWSDLRQRVGPNRRCFAFMHVALLREPVVVVHAAIVPEISQNIQAILGNSQMMNGGDSSSSSSSFPSSIPLDKDCGENPLSMTTAVFYSITSTQKGLQGIEFGNHLIMQIIKELKNEFKRMHKFSSLSPIPGFREWLLDELNLQIHLHEIGEEPEHLLLSSQDVIDLSSVSGSSEAAALSVLQEVLVSNSWLERPHWFPVLKRLLMKQCARYLYLAKKRGYTINPVANFHLRNGAVLWRINWMADTSSRGVAASFGIMVNYRYYPEEMEANSKKYIERRSIAVSDQVMELVRQLHDEGDAENHR